MDAIQLFAWIVVIAAAVKILVLLVNPKAWIRMASKIWKYPSAMMIVSLILGAVVLYYLIQTLSIIQIFAVILLVMLLSASTMAAYSKEFSAFIQKLSKERNVIGKAWLALIVWVALLVWAITALI
jgi:hypothetical protein